jgi:hypothetical protein
MPLPAEPDVQRGALADGNSRFECSGDVLTLYTAAAGVGEVRSVWYRVD